MRANSDKVIECWTLVWVFFPALLNEVVEVWREGGGDWWTFTTCDTHQHINIIIQISIWELVGKELKKGHAIGEQITFLVDPSSGFPHDLGRHLAVCPSLFSGDGVRQLACRAKVAYFSHPSTHE